MYYLIKVRFFYGSLKRVFMHSLMLCMFKILQTLGVLFIARSYISSINQNYIYFSWNQKICKKHTIMKVTLPCTYWIPNLMHDLVSTQISSTGLPERPQQILAFPVECIHAVCWAWALRPIARDLGWTQDGMSYKEKSQFEAILSNHRLVYQLNIFDTFFSNDYRLVSFP